MSTAPSADKILGGYLMGILLAVALYGTGVAQAYIYWLNSSEDSALMKATVGAVVFFETVHTVFTSHLTYHYTITTFGNFEGVGRIVWYDKFIGHRTLYLSIANLLRSAAACVFTSLVIILLVQLEQQKQTTHLGLSHCARFATRFVPSSSCEVKSLIHLSVDRIWLCIWSPHVSVEEQRSLSIAPGPHTPFVSCRLHTWSDFRRDAAPLSTLISGLALSAVMDLLIAFTLIYFLSRQRSGFKHTDHIVQRLMAYSVNTGAITMICQILVIVVFVAEMNSLSFAGLYLMASKLYANSLLGALNARHILQDKQGELKPSPWRLHSAQSQNRPIEIFQEMSKITDVDYPHVSQGIGW
ncbi:hypothetical protein NLI96_g3425 [Meripilus lineatus]|uniref:DUF6534 domain-containing protein n=1 Tax=Meripilus lineatus TaxID=2056292 RepID=A0AAD5YL17_9APHY|nr:hypothetical protein NLI96_g3425 [Physisporinus lineatus]